MAASSLASEPTQEIFSWLKTLPLAPEYHPTLAEFQDPISYIFKIEKEASKYGICKIVPPVQPSSKKTAISNLNKSLLARSSSSDPNNPKSPPTFTTRQQQIGFCPRRPRPIQKPVWQSGEYYTFQQFEAKAKSFEKNYLKKFARKGGGGGGGLSPLEIETLYWKATVDKPFRVEYANDMPGSAFIPISTPKKKLSKTGCRETGEGVSLGETDWNMRGVARAKGSLLKFMKEEIPGVTSPMVYVAMMFSWFAWHVEDHDLHSLNYLHMGAGKTWYGVPRDAAVAFEEVIRVHGYGGEINPLVTFAVLGEKTTVMSPEVFINAGIPCCRLVQNAGEFVVTFPRAYHTGFSHGFNCGEATNIATPEWLRFAKEAAIRRASINYPPMVSHFQLLYDLALALCSRKPEDMGSEPRSSRLKDKKKSEGETVIKELFVRNVEKNNKLLHILGKGSSVVLLPWNSTDISVCSKLRVGSHLRGNPPSFPPLGVCPSRESIKSSILDQAKDFYLLKGTFSSSVHSANGHDYSSSSKAKILHAEGLSDQRLFSCVTCGILNFDCLAVIQPKEEAARNLMSADCSFFNDWIGGSMLPHNGGVERSVRDDVSDVPVHTLDDKIPRKDEAVIAISNNDALGLLASTYGDSSDSEQEDQTEDNTTNLLNGCRSEIKNGYENSDLPSTSNQGLSCSKINGGDEKFNCLGQLEPTDDNGDSNVISCSNKGKNSTQEDDKSAIVPMGEKKNVSFFSRSDEDTSRLHVFCLEHAVEVEQQLQPIGGVHIMLLCHPDYPKIESEAKMVAEDLGIDRIWNDIIFREATKEDEKTIQLALDNEEAFNGNGNWAVKLGINLFYSANLSHSPLYIKQMPYNSVIYNAFGRSSPSFSSRKTKVYERRSGRQKRVVAGKWCGKVWMSNQVHPFLAKKDTEEEYEEENDDDNDRSFFAWSMPNEKLGRKSETGTATTRKASRKRKLTSRNLSNKKSKWVEPKTSIFSEDLMQEDDHRPCSWRKQRTSKKPKFVETEEAFSEDMEGEGNLCGQHGRNSMSKYVTYFEIHDDVATSENSLGENEDVVSDQSHGYNDDHYQQYRRIPRTKQAKWTEREKDAVYDDSLGDEEEESHQDRNISKSKQTKWNKSEDVGFSDEDSMEYDSHEPVPRSTQGKWIQGDDDVAFEDSLRNRRIPESKWIERRDYCDDDDDVASNDSLGDDSHQQGRRLPRKRQQGGGAILSDESMHNTNSSRHYKRAPRSKQMKFIEKEERVSDDLIKNASNHQNTTRRSLRRKPAKSDSVLPMRRAGSSTQAKLRTSRSSKSKNTSRVRLFDSDAEEEEQDEEDEEEDGFEGGPSTRPRRRTPKPVRKSEDKPKEKKKQPSKKKVTNRKEAKVDGEEEEDELGYVCDIDGCSMSFRLKNELLLHKKNICPLKGCGKKFFAHKYLVQHRRVHVDDRPLKCPWKGCKMSFKWPWARTEHIRVHTGARPYVCSEPGCAQTFRFVSDFSRHKRKTGHSVKKGRK